MKRLFFDLRMALHETARLFGSALGRPHTSRVIVITNDGYLDPP